VKGKVLPRTGQGGPKGCSAAVLRRNYYFAGCGDESLLPPVLRQFWWQTFYPAWGDRSRNVCIFGSDITDGTYSSRLEDYWTKMEQTLHFILWTNDSTC